VSTTDISWRACSAGVFDPLYPGVCNTTPSHLTIAVTISAVWLNVPTGPAVLSDDGVSVLITKGSVPEIVRRIGWHPLHNPSGSPTISLLDYNDPAGFKFLHVGSGIPDQVDNTLPSRL
jgi:hypothetical protein